MATWLSTIFSRRDADAASPDERERAAQQNDAARTQFHGHIPEPGLPEMLDILPTPDDGLKMVEDVQNQFRDEHGNLPHERFRDRWYGAMLAALPQLVGIDVLFILFLFVWRLGSPQNAVYLTAGCILAFLSLFFMALLFRHHLLGFMTMAVGFGSLVGHGYYCSHFYQVWSYDARAGYTGVHAASPAKSRADAGSLAFTKTTHVDITQPLGYRRGDVYCVAPIIDDAIEDATINYWAVGLNCCGARDAFRCHDSLDPIARGGMVLAAQPISNFHASPLKMYQKAAEIACGQYDLTQSPDALFVYWTYNLAEARDNIITDAYHHFSYSAVIFLCFLMPTYGLVAVSHRTAHKTPRSVQ